MIWSVKTVPLNQHHHHPTLPFHKCLNFLQFLSTYQVLLPSIVIFNELFMPAFDLWSWFTLTKKNNLLLTGRTDGGDEKRHNGVLLQSIFAFKHKSFIVCLCIEDTCLFLMPFIFLSHQIPNACHWPSSVLLSASFSLISLLSFQHIVVQLSCYSQAQPVLLSQTFVHPTQAERHPLACKLEDINQFKKH